MGAKEPVVTLSALSDAVKSGQLSARELTARYLDRIAASSLNAVLELNPEALAIAKRIDENPLKTGALCGVPLLIKDNIDTGDSMRTSAGSLALAENFARADAPIVQRLREEGAILLGKTNLTEFANYMAENMPNGYSSRGGQTVSPFDRDADPSGSSTGSAVAVAAGLCAAAVGTETCGSVISPSQQAGIVGIKPTAGLCDNRGIVPISFTLDTPGPMARCAADAGTLLGVLAGRRYDTPVEGLAGVRVGICRQFTEGVDPEWLAANERLADVMRELGADCAELPEHELHTGYLWPITRFEFKNALNRYLRSMGNPTIPQSLGEIIAYNRLHVEEALKYGQDVLEDAEDNTTGDLSELAYQEALAARQDAIRAFDTLFDGNGIDLFFVTAANSGLAAATGFPSMTIPVGRTAKGLPIGSFFVARRFREDVLLRLAAALERVAGETGG